jgi:hypothetical protein
VLADVLGDRLQKVRLAEPGASVDEERVVGLSRSFGDRERGRMGEAVRGADHERVERVLRVQANAERVASLLRFDGRDGLPRDLPDR